MNYKKVAFYSKPVKFQKKLSNFCACAKINNNRLSKSKDLIKTITNPNAIVKRKHKFKITIHGKEFESLGEAAKHYKIDRRVISGRIKRGLTPEEAVNTPETKPQKVIKYTHLNNELYGLRQIAKYFNTTPSTIRYQLAKGKTLKEAIEYLLNKKRLNNDKTPRRPKENN